MGLRAAVIRLSPVIHEGEQRVSSLSDPPFEKSWLRPCEITMGNSFSGLALPPTVQTPPPLSKNPVLLLLYFVFERLENF